MHTNKIPLLLNLKSGINALLLTPIFLIFLTLGFVSFIFYQSFSPQAGLQSAAATNGFVVVFPTTIEAPKTKTQETKNVVSQALDATNPLLKNALGLDAIDLIGRAKTEEGLLEKWGHAPGVAQPQDVDPQPAPEIQDARALLEHMVSYIDEVVDLKSLELFEINPLLPFMMPEDDPILSEGFQAVMLTVAHDSTLDHKVFLSDIQGVIPGAFVYSNQDFFGEKIQMLQQVSDQFFFVTILMVFGLIVFQIVMTRTIFEQHREDCQTLSYIGANHKSMTHIFRVFFQRQFVRSFVISILLGTALFSLLSMATGFADRLTTSLSQILLWGVLFSITAGAAYLITLEVFIRRQVRFLK